MYQYKARLVKVVDGDTVDLAIDLGFYLVATVRCRLLGINTPERGQPGYSEASLALGSMLMVQNTWIVRTEKGDAFGRWLVTIAPDVSTDSVTVNQRMINEGFAVAYRG